MKSTLLFVALSLITITGLTAQDYIRMIESGQYTVKEIVDQTEDFYKNRDKGRGSGYKQFKRWEYNALRMMDDNGYLASDELYIREWEKINSAENEMLNGFLRSSDFWSEHGPNYYSASTSWSPGVGRITAFCIHPENENIIFVGAESGGIWRSLDGGASWKSLTDYFSNLAVESIIMQPGNSSVLYFGSTQGRIYKSVDSGDTWVLWGTAGTSRIRRLLINPENLSIMFACSQNAGVYRSTDEGKTWAKVSTDSYAYDIAFKPGDLNTIYATGYYFQKSTDGGKTFKVYSAGQTQSYIMNVTQPESLKKGYNAVQNAFSPGHVPIPFSPDSIEARIVLFKDTDGNNSIGCSEPVNAAELQGNIAVIRRGDCYFVAKVMNAQNAGAVAVIIVNKNPGEASFAMSGSDPEIAIPAIMISYEEGEALIENMKTINITVKLQIDSKAYHAMKISPKALGVSPADPEVIYILEAVDGRFSGFFKSQNAGESFVKLNHIKNYMGYSADGDDDGGQAPRNMEIAVNPSNADEVHIGGIMSWSSFDGGISFNCTSHWVPGTAEDLGIGYCHADINRMFFYKDRLYLGTDGGIFKSTDTKNISENFYTDLTNGLGIRHFYKIGVSQTNPVVVSGGSQDNGTSWYSAQSGWSDWLGADGMESFIDKNDPEIIFGTIQYGSMYRKEKSGNITGLQAPDERTGNWVTPFEQDPMNNKTIYVAYEAVYKSSDYGNNWVQISQEFSSKLNHLKISPSNNNIIYGSALTELYKTTTGEGTWERIYTFAGNINSIAIHPKDPNKIAVAVSGASKVFVSYDGGKVWKLFLKNLPSFSALALVWQDDNVDGLYLGMNYGVFYINNTMNNWISYANNLPNVIINELEINYAEKRIYAATYGRGLWSSPIFEYNPDNTFQQPLPEVIISPNPATDFLVINVEDHDFDIENIEIYSTKGQLIKKTSPRYKTSVQVDLSDIAAGSYFVRINSKSGRFSKKIEILK